MFVRLYSYCQVRKQHHSAMKTNHLERIYVIKMSTYCIVINEVTDMHVRSDYIPYMSHVDTGAYLISYHACFRAPINFIPCSHNDIEQLSLSFNFLFSLLATTNVTTAAHSFYFDGN